MSFQLMTDSTANIPDLMAASLNIAVIPFIYTFDGKETYPIDLEHFDGPAFYNAMRSGTKVQTSQIAPQRYVDFMRPYLEQGQDILMICMSSGISGSAVSAAMAAEELREEFPNRSIQVVDTYAASLGEGILVLKAHDWQQEGKSCDEVADLVNALKKCMYQVFTVDDLKYLRNTGRISHVLAMVGTILNIKPILKGNEIGQIVQFERVRGRRKAIEALAERYRNLVKDPDTQIVGIAHADASEDAEYLAQLLNEYAKPKQILNVMYEPTTGSHVGPGTVALFFLGNEDVRSH